MSNNGIHPTRDTPAVIDFHLAGGRVMPGIRPLGAGKVTIESLIRGSMMRRIVLAITVLVTTTPGVSSAQTRDGLVGTWRLVSASATTASGDRNEAPFGASPKGVLIYTREGRMSGIISHSGRKPLSRADQISAPAEERAEAFATFFAYAGRYSLRGDQVIHHVEISSVENLVNTDLVRLIKLEGDRLTLRTPPRSIGGAVRTDELIWERVKN